MGGSDQFFRVSTVLLGKAATVSIGMVVKCFALGSNGAFAGLRAARSGRLSQAALIKDIFFLMVRTRFRFFALLPRATLEKP